MCKSAAIDALARLSERVAGEAQAAPRPDVVVFGHTHVLDWAVQKRPDGDGLYVNLGTWTERCFDPGTTGER